MLQQSGGESEHRCLFFFKSQLPLTNKGGRALGLSRLKITTSPVPKGLSTQADGSGSEVTGGGGGLSLPPAHAFQGAMPKVTALVVLP